MFMPSFAAVRRRSRALILFTAMLASAASLSGCAVDFPTPTPPAANATLINGGHDGLLVPLHVERVDQDHARLGVPLQLDGKAVYVALDTGTQGLRILKSVLPDSNHAAAGERTSLSFANGVQVSGAAVKLPVGLAGTAPTPMTAQAVDDIRCLPSAKRCVAMDGYTGEFGWAFSGVLGVGADTDAAPPNSACCTQPLRALPGKVGQRYLVHANFAEPYLVLSPSNALMNSYTLVPMTMAKDGGAHWPRGCVNVAGKMTFCAPVVFATGTSGMIRIETDTVPNWIGDGDEDTVLKQGNFDVALGLGSWVHRYDAAQVTVVKAKPGLNRIVIGLAAMQNVDVLFDFQRGQIGMHAANASETFAP